MCPCHPGRCRPEVNPPSISLLLACATRWQSGAPAAMQVVALLALLIVFVLEAAVSVRRWTHETLALLQLIHRDGMQEDADNEAGAPSCGRAGTARPGGRPRRRARLALPLKPTPRLSLTARGRTHA